MKFLMNWKSKHDNFLFQRNPLIHAMRGSRTNSSEEHMHMYLDRGIFNRPLHKPKLLRHRIHGEAESSTGAAETRSGHQ